MRTTVTLDDDVARLLLDAQHRDRATFKQALNDALRRGLAQGTPAVAPYVLRPHRSDVRAGVDVSALNRLADDLEDEEIVGRGRR